MTRKDFFARIFGAAAAAPVITKELMKPAPVAVPAIKAPAMPDWVGAFAPCKTYYVHSTGLGDYMPMNWVSLDRCGSWAPPSDFDRPRVVRGGFGRRIL